MIEIWEPRYHDMTVLIHAKKIRKDKDAPVQIMKGKYAGKYIAPWDTIKSCKVEHKEYGDMVIVPFSKLVKAE
jgi:hypothetical protein